MTVTIYYRKESEPRDSTQHVEVGIDAAVEAIRELCFKGFVIVNVSEVKLA